MARANTIQTNFTAGEISPLMYGRVDVNKYFNGARKLQNMIVLPQGGAYRRPGTQYFGETKSSGYAIFKKFVFSTTQFFTLEFGNTYIRFWNASGPVLLSGTPYEVTTTYLTSELPYLSFAQSADVIYIGSIAHPTMKLSRLSDTNWTLTQVSFNDGPYLDVDETDNRVKIEVNSDITSMVASISDDTSTIIASTGIFSSGSVGKYVDYVNYTDHLGFHHWGLTSIDTFVSSTTITGTPLPSSSIIDSAYAAVTFSGGQIHSNTDIFTSTSVGKYIRLSSSQVWYLITSIANTKIANGTAVTLVTYTYPTTTVTPQVGFVSGDVAKFIEYKEAGLWRIAQILTVVSPSRVTVKVIDNVKDVDSIVSITDSGGTGSATISSSNAGIFSPNDVGYYIRDSSQSRWFRITAYTASDKVTGTFITLFAYTFPSVTMTLLNDRVITVTLSSNNQIFDPINDVGIQVRLQFASKWRSFVATGIVSSNVAVGTLNAYIPWDTSNANKPYSGGFADKFRMGAWTHANGYPSLVCFHQGRLGFARTLLQPTTAWLTETDDYESLAPTELDGLVLDTNAITFTIANNQVNQIKWMRSGPVMLIGTQGDEFQLKPSNLSQALSPTNFVVVSQTAYGSTDVDAAQRINSQTLFIQRGGLKIRELTYNFQIDAFEAKDISIISEHLFRSSPSNASDGNPLTTVQGIVAMDVGHAPVTIGWIVLADGKLIGMTYERDQDVIAFHRHQIGGSGVVESVCVTPDAQSNSDIIWLIVKRTINGSVKRYVEIFKTIQIFDTVNTTVYMDCWKSMPHNIDDVTDQIGFDHLMAAVVQVTVDGIYIGTKTVVTTSSPSGKGFTVKYLVNSSVIAGFQCEGIIGVLDPEGGSQAGSSQGKKKRVAQLTIRIDSSTHFKIASTPGTTDDRQTVSASTDPASTDWTLIIPDIVLNPLGVVGHPYPPPASAGPTQYTGDITTTMDVAFDEGGRFQIVQDQPYPLKVVALLPKLDTNE